MINFNLILKTSHVKKARNKLVDLILLRQPANLDFRFTRNVEPTVNTIYYAIFGIYPICQYENKINYFGDRRSI